MDRTVGFLQYLAQALYAVVFLVVVVRAARQPLRANVDMALFFGATAVAIAASALLQLLDTDVRPLASGVLGICIMALPYLLLRLVRDFSEVPTLVVRAVELGLLLSAVGLVLVPSQL